MTKGKKYSASKVWIYVLEGLILGNECLGCGKSMV
jgi:hypothetical protein